MDVDCTKYKSGVGVSGLAEARKLKQFVASFWWPNAVVINQFCKDYNCTVKQISGVHLGNSARATTELYAVLEWN